MCPPPAGRYRGRASRRAPRTTVLRRRIPRSESTASRLRARARLLWPCACQVPDRKANLPGSGPRGVRRRCAVSSCPAPCTTRRRVAPAPRAASAAAPGGILPGTTHSDGDFPFWAAAFHAWLGIRDGSKSSGVVFIVELNCRELGRRLLTPGRWEPLTVPLDPPGTAGPKP
jgi:hypothetical protein